MRDMATTTKRRLSALLLLALLCVSCDGVSKAYVKADELTYDAIAPEYLKYVQADEALSDAQKKRRATTVDTWRTRIEGAKR